LSVATLNVAHGRGLARTQVGLPRQTFAANLDHIAALLKQKQPEVVALQEADAASVWSGKFDHVARVAEAAGYPHRHHGWHVNTGIGGKRLRYGTALLSQPALFSRTAHAFAQEPTDTKGFVAAEIDFQGRRLLVASVHLDFKSSWTRRRQAEQLVEHFTGADRPLVIMGDFNCGGEEDDALTLIACGLGLRAYRLGATDLDTYPSCAPRARIDWILISRELRFIDYHVWPECISDHRGVAATIGWAD
jgi:endonuclease/exonuclease/phosphatase family metal-dependent hydrolase